MVDSGFTQQITLLYSRKLLSEPLLEHWTISVDQDVLSGVVSVVEWVSDQEVLITEFTPEKRLVKEWADHDLVPISDC